MRSIIEWSVRRPVVANLMMIFLLVVGTYCAWTMRREIFPEFSLDRVQVSVVYKGASVEEIEESICSKIEEEITGVEGIKKITSTSVEGKGVVTAELESSVNVNRVLNDVKNMVDQIDTFPVESERPLTVELIAKVPVIKVAVYGDVSEHVLTSVAEYIKAEILALPNVSQVELVGAREHEVSIEIPESNLRRYGLTLTQVADLIKKNTLDLPGGSIRAEAGQLLLRTKGRRYYANEFEDLEVVSRLDGTTVPLRRIAKITDTFEEVDLQARMDGKPAVVVRVDKTSKQDAVKIAEAIRKYVKEKSRELPDTLKLAVWDDSSVFIKSRLDLMIRNGRSGLILVLIILALFLRLRLAFWVAMGIPISILGSFVFLTAYDYTLNMISMYAFIVVLGIVVDDAIVVGENVYSKMAEGQEPIPATVNGAMEIAYPVVNAVATTIVAFAPMLFVAGTMGKFMRVFPIAIIAVLLVSLFEVFVILPAHLAHMKRSEDKSSKWNPFLWAEWVRIRVQTGLDRFVNNLFIPFMRLTLRHRYVFTAGALSLLILCFGLIAGGRIAFVFFPKVDSDRISAQLTMPDGTSFSRTQAEVKKIERAAWEMARKYEDGSGTSVITHMFALIGEPLRPDLSQDKGSHIAEITIELKDSEHRKTSSAVLTNTWRELTGPVPGALSLIFSSDARGHRPGGKPIEIVLLGERQDQLLQAADRLKKALGHYEGVEDVQDSYRAGKPELQFSLKEGARQLGVSLVDIARQVRANFWGEEALKVQRGRNEVTIRVRYPEHERESRGSLDNMKILTAQGKEIPFQHVAEVSEYQGPSNIHRKYGKRAITVTSDIDEDKTNAGDILAKMSESVFPKLKRELPGIDIILEGQEQERADSVQSLFKGLVVALFLIYMLLVNMFRTYTHPIIIMTAIPFSFIGIVLGHLLFGMDFTILSMFGVLALAGVVVNDSLLLIEASNRSLERGNNLAGALEEGARNRFRQIILTSLSTTAGLTPLLMETSFQAQFLKPMTITVVFGLMAATFLILLLVPALTMIRADILTAMGRRI
jgi:HAE1 family hydrophobic/amphiphilic exporter-1